MPIPSLQPQHCTWNTDASLTEEEVGCLHFLKRDNIPKKEPPPLVGMRNRRVILGQPATRSTKVLCRIAITRTN